MIINLKSSAYVRHIIITGINGSYQSHQQTLQVFRIRKSPVGTPFGKQSMKWILTSSGPPARCFCTTVLRSLKRYYQLQHINFYHSNNSLWISFFLSLKAPAILICNENKKMMRQIISHTTGRSINGIMFLEVKMVIFAKTLKQVYIFGFSNSILRPYSKNNQRYRKIFV